MTAGPADSAERPVAARPTVLPGPGVDADHTGTPVGAGAAVSTGSTGAA